MGESELIALMIWGEVVGVPGGVVGWVFSIEASSFCTGEVLFSVLLFSCEYSVAYTEATVSSMGLFSPSLWHKLCSDNVVEITSSVLSRNSSSEIFIMLFAFIVGVVDVDDVTRAEFLGLGSDDIPL